MNRMNFSRRSRPASKRTEDSFIISDSDEEAASSFRKNVTVARNPIVIGDSETDSEISDNAESNADSRENAISSEASEDEDLHFMNASHKVSIVESSSGSESESDHKKLLDLKKLKRRSIYENPVESESELLDDKKEPELNKLKRPSLHNNVIDSPRSESTPVNVRKKSRRAIIISDDSDSEIVTVKQNSSVLKNVRRSLAKEGEAYGDSSFKQESKVGSINSSLNNGDTNEQLSEDFKSVSRQDQMEFSILSKDDDNDEHEYELKPKNDISARRNESVKNSDPSYEPESDLSKSDSSSSFTPFTLLGKQNEREIPNDQIDLTIDSKNPSKQIKNKKLISNGNAEDSEIIISSSTDPSDNEIDPEAAAFARKELGVGNIDPIEAQKREHLEINIRHVQQQLDKLNKFAASVDVEKLPDKGDKVHQTIREHEEKLIALKQKLNKLSRKTRSSTPMKVKTPIVKVEPKRNVDIDDSFDTPIKKEIKKYISSDDSYESPALIEKKDIKNNNVKREVNNKFEDFDVLAIPNVPQESFDTADLGKKALETLHKQQTLTHQRIEQLHGSLTTRPTEDVREKDPYGLKIALMPHQQHALAWMRWREKQKPRGGILADDMGLGKTLTMISLVLAHVNEKGSDDSDSGDDAWFSKNKHKRYYGGTLVVCPASLLRQWEAEVKNRCKRGLLTVLVYHGNNRNVEERKLSKYNIVVTTYQIMVREQAAETGLYKMEWTRVILDEAHYIRNHKSKACIAVSGLNAKNRWALTGTPIQNKEADLYAILKFLKCSPFDDFQVWKRWVENKSDAGRQRLITIMKTVMLRRTKQELQAKGSLDSLPEKFSEIVEIDMDEEETLAYQKILLFSQNLFAQFLSQRAEKQHLRELHGGKFDRPSFASQGAKTHFTKAQQVLLSHHKEIEAHEILVLLLRLRQMCCHPALIHAMLDKNEAEVSGVYEDEEVNTDLLKKLKNMSMNDEEEEIEEHVKNFKIDDKITSNLLTKKNPVFDDDRRGSKVRAVMKTIEEIIDKGDKLIVVSQWSSFLKVIAKNLEDVDDAKYDMFTGEVAVKNRQAIVDRFNDPREETNVLLLSLTAGGVGLNLIGANHLLLIDIHWNPQLESQAQDRIYRFGQKKDVHVYKYMCKDTIEERVKQLQDKKLEIANHVLTGTRSVSSKLTIEDLKLLFS